MGGRIAEEMFMNHITTGAGNDIERATDLARKMVCEWGMSDLGPLSFGKKEEQIFLGREIAQHRDYSEATAIKIDEEVQRLVQDGYDTGDAHHRRPLGRAGPDRRGAAGAGSSRRRRSEATHRRPAVEGIHPRHEPRNPEGKQEVIRPEGGNRVPG